MSLVLDSRSGSNASRGHRGSNMQLSHAIAESVQRHGSHAALRGRDRTLSYDELWTESGRVLQQLRDQGIGRGSFVLVCSPNSVSWLTFFLAAVRAECLVGVLDSTVQLQYRETIVADLAPAAIFADGELRCPILAHGSAHAAHALERTTAMIAAGTQLLIFTSGSTGQPKGVLVSEENVVANISWNADAFGLSHESVTCSFMPLCTFLSLSYVIACLAVGATVLIEQNLSELQKTLEGMSEAGVTHLNTVPLALRSIVERGDLEGHPLRALRCIRVGAGALTADLAERAFAAFPGARIVTTYGMTEIGIVATRQWTAASAASFDAGTFTHVTDGEELALVDDREGAGSEIQLSSAFLFRGYYDVANRSVEVRSGPYLTGDLGEWTGESGQSVLRLRARRKQIAKVAGVLVNLDEVSRIGASCGMVADSYAIGVDHPVLGEEVHLFVAEKAGCAVDPREVGRVLMETTTMKRVPRIHVIRALPRTAMGKVSRADLERMARGLP